MSERQLSDLHKNHIGFVFQSYHLIDDLTVYENLETPLLYKKVKGSERKGKIADMLDRFHMVAKKNLFPNQLSGGQQQKVAVARAIIIDPTTIIQVTHSEKNAAYGRRIINLLDGWIVDEP